MRDRTRPDVAAQYLLLDEPSLGLAPIVVKQVMPVIGAIVEHGIGVLLVEQNVAQALKLAKYAYVLEHAQSRSKARPKNSWTTTGYARHIWALSSPTSAGEYCAWTFNSRAKSPSSPVPASAWAARSRRCWPEKDAVLRSWPGADLAEKRWPTRSRRMGSRAPAGNRRDITQHGRAAADQGEVHRPLRAPRHPGQQCWRFAAIDGLGTRPTWDEAMCLNFHAVRNSPMLSCQYAGPALRPDY